MNRTLYPLLLAGGLLLGAAAPALAQDDLLNELEKETTDPQRREVVQATFKGTHVVNSQSIETPGQGTLAFLIQHRFGTLNSGAYEFFGLDQAELRLSFEYGLTNRLALGVGRTKLGKTFDGFVKYRALQQSTGAGAMPVSLSLLASAAIVTTKFATGPGIEGRDAASRMAYTYQALLARKFSPSLSIQLMPTLIHRNYVDTDVEQNDVYALGGAIRQKVSKRIALTADYFYVLPGHTADTYRNAAGLGVDIETGGHVFQLHFTNSQGLIESQFVPQTSGNIWDGDIYFGFTVARNFTVKSNLK